MKRKWPKTLIVVPVPIYGGTLYVARSHAEYNAALAYMRVARQDDLPAAGCAQTFQRAADDGTTVYMLGLFDGAPGTLAHEVCHTAFNIFERVGANPEDGRCNEAFCYLVGWLVWKIMEKL